MKIVTTLRFDRLFASASSDKQAAFRKQSRLLLEDIRHPSLRAKKYDEVKGLWQARLTGNWRFNFLIVGDTYIMTHIGPHPK
jgi:hypothetical protein